MTKRVIGVYYTVPEALEVIDELRKEGYTNKEIFVVANEEITGQIPYIHEVERPARGKVEEIHPSLWKQIKDAFTLEEPIYNDADILEDDLMYQYRAI
ncbi:general stress protein [Dolosicoccus paucivorans]|uniref:Uncharacterized protein n=1 Tax=Dolosicoccus paucivorans TaxID=84521 RepID=A0A2N6SKY1_9LACT|nr:general stress protein [Dolosicoccus paucivorans]PMB83937.1 hypothetical protein CJ206_06415 [Dolosicoccus paucivorans]PMC57748.1 hypothetical protein CJ205_08060 [Dolosicoccus paucivorans]